MKLGKLLGVGKSFFGGGHKAAYQLHRRATLPKFNEGRNPFAPKTAEVTPAELPVAAAASKVLTASKAETKVFSTAPVVAQKAPMKPVPPYAAKPVVKFAPKSAAQPVIQTSAKPLRPGWTTRLNPFRAPEPVVRPALAVQPELSLDAVKVVHNDLADADVEIVPVKSHSDAPLAVPMLAPARHAWEYMGESLLKSS